MIETTPAFSYFHLGLRCKRTFCGSSWKLGLAIVLHFLGPCCELCRTACRDLFPRLGCFCLAPEGKPIALIALICAFAFLLCQHRGWGYNGEAAAGCLRSSRWQPRCVSCAGPLFMSADTSDVYTLEIRPAAFLSMLISSAVFFTAQTVSALRWVRLQVKEGFRKKKEEKLAVFVSFQGCS